VFLSVKELEVKKIRFDVEFPPGEILFEERGVRQVSPLRAEGEAELLNNTLGEIRVQGKVAVDLEMECDRCLDPTQHRVANDFDLYYRPAPVETAHHEVALDEGESQIGFYEDGGMELGDVLREHILLSLPMQQICREDCLGICPECGANRNTVECHCEKKHTDDRWAALRELRGSLGSKPN
jgi:uncharacterized protein